VNDVQQDVVREFLVESYENLEQLDRDLVLLEQDRSSQSTLGSIFRTIHTIKGTCGFLGFWKLESVAHVGENLLSKLRDGELHLRPDITTALLALVDAVREILGNIESVGAEGEADYTELIQTLIRFLENASDSSALSVPASNAAPQSAMCTSSAEAVAVEDPHDEGVLHTGETGTAIGGVKSCQSSAVDSTIRVDVGLLDKLMNRVGELVLARNQILQYTRARNDSALLGTSQRINLITTELQEGVMKTRMQPIGNVWSKFSRVVRDLAVQCGKQVRIEMEGKETELDKTIIEAIKDPLTHLVRNAIDHGIEPPELRVAAGKPAEGCLLLRAFHEGGQVNIEVIDDGAGLNFDRIRQKAVERGLITRDQSLRMPDRDVAQLIFAPGFSTNDTVTNISGRGVGLDVVKTNVEKIGGSIEIQGHGGYGTTIKLKIPLTLAIIPALIVTCCGDRYAIPQVSLLEVVRLEGEQAKTGIEQLYDVPVFRLRDQLLPIVDLRSELDLHCAEAGAATLDINNDVVNIVVLQADNRQFGLAVESINDTEEIVVKPLSKQVKGIGVYAGATIMGDGKVALILDVIGVAQCAGVVSNVRDHTPTEYAARPLENSAVRHALAILEVSDRRLAVPISAISRLEQIPRAAVEKAGRHDVVQYRGGILPLVRLGEILGVETKENIERPLQVVVYSERSGCVGIVVDRIADVVETVIEATNHWRSEDQLASSVIQHRVTDLLDLPSLLHRADPTLFDAPIASGATA
jgi:two-component system, chemotaxis family, sensor kinase CheA